MQEKQLETPSHFDQGAAYWDQRPLSQQLAQGIPRVLDALPLKPDQHWLDFGAGTGLLSVPLAERVAQVTALDTSAAMLQVLQEKGITQVKTVQQDLFCGLPERFDGIASCMALHHVEPLARLLQTFAEHLKPGGLLGLVDLYAEDGSFHGDNQAKGVKHLGFDPETLKVLLTHAGFTAIRFEEILHLAHRNGRSYPLFLVQAIRSSQNT